MLTFLFLPDVSIGQRFNPNRDDAVLPDGVRPAREAFLSAATDHSFRKLTQSEQGGGGTVSLTVVKDGKLPKMDTKRINS